MPRRDSDQGSRSADPAHLDRPSADSIARTKHAPYVVLATMPLSIATTRGTIDLCPMADWTHKVRDRLRERKLSYRAIAARLGVDPGAVGNWMIGKRTPTVENLTNLAKELGFTLSELMGDDAATSPIESQVLRTFRDMTPLQQEAALAFLTSITRPR